MAFKEHSSKDVDQACLSYFKGDELAASVFKTKYIVKNERGELMEKTPADMHDRLSKAFSKIEEHYGGKALSEAKIRELMDGFNHVIPQGSVMSVLGNPYVIGSLSNCVVIPKIFDSYGGIMYADQQLAQLMKRRCGVGADISTLRPNKSNVSNAAMSSTGAVSFMERFSNTTREVAQDGRRMCA